MYKILCILALCGFLVFTGFGCNKSRNTKNVIEIGPVEMEIKPESSNIKRNKIENGEYLPVPYFYQKDILDHGSYACGIASLKMVWDYALQTGKVQEDVSVVPEMMFSHIGTVNDMYADSNVDNNFIEGWGITDVALKKLAEEIEFKNVTIIGKSFTPNYPAAFAVDPGHEGQLISSEDFKAPIDEENWDTDRLYDAIEEGNPVIVDVTTNMDPLLGPNNECSYAPFISEDDVKHFELETGKGHFMVVVGFQNWGKDNTKIILLDPLQKTDNENNISIYSLDQFEKSWALLNNQGLLVK